MASVVALEITEEAKAIMDKAGARALAKGISIVESVMSIDTRVLACIGAGTLEAEQLQHCSGAVETAAVGWRIARAIVAADYGLRKSGVANGDTKAERFASATVSALRSLTAIMSEMKATAEANRGNGGPVTVVSGSEEDRAYSVATYGVTEMKVAEAIVEKLYNRKVRPNLVPPLSKMKKIAYAVMVDECWPSPKRVPLESMRTDPKDSFRTLFRRLVNGVIYCAAGKVVKAGVRDDGAGVVRGSPDAQWASNEQAEKMLEEVDESIDGMPEDAQGRLGSLILSQLHKATSAGGQSPSLEMSLMVSRVPEYATARSGATTQSTGAGTKRTGEKRKRNRGAKDTETKAPTKAPKKTESSNVTWPDEDGVDGPGGQKRKRGGNPKGNVCKYVAKGETCPFKFCSFSHEK